MGTPGWVRPERVADTRAIHAVHVASFPTFAESRLVEQLRHSGRLVASLVAELDERVVGHAAFSPVSAPAGAHGVGLGPVAVLPDYRRRGIAAELIRKGLETCRSSQFGWAVVLGEPAYYARFGFRDASDFGLTCEFGGSPAFQCLELISPSLPLEAGLVHYAPEFRPLR